MIVSFVKVGRCGRQLIFQAKVYLRAAKRRATVITSTDGKALTPELVGFAVVSDVGGNVTDTDTAGEEAA